jgi:DNA-binding IclR family transcriptional regulator
MLESSRKLLASLQKGLDILCCFDFTRPCLSAQEISGRLNLPLSTTYKYLESLQEKGFLVRNQETRNYEIGLMLFRLGNITGSRMKLVDIALPHMKALSAGSGETVLLTVISGREVVCVERVETNGRIRLSLERGSSLPLHAGASSKILLAYQKESFVDFFLRENPSLVRFTERTLTDPLLLKLELSTIRKQGFAFSDHEVDVGVRAVGSAVFNHRAEVVAGLSIAGPSERMNDDILPGLILLVKEAAEKVSRDMGHERETGNREDGAGMRET